MPDRVKGGCARKGDTKGWESKLCVVGALKEESLLEDVCELLTKRLIGRETDAVVWEDGGTSGSVIVCKDTKTVDEWRDKKPRVSLIKMFFLDEISQSSHQKLKIILFKDLLIIVRAVIERWIRKQEQQWIDLVLLVGPPSTVRRSSCATATHSGSPTKKRTNFLL